MDTNSLRPLNFAGKLFFILLATGIFMSFMLVAEFHTNPFRVPTFADIPVCYIYGNAFLAIALAALMKKSFLRSILSIAGFVVGLTVSAYFFLICWKFARNADLYSAEILGIKTAYTDFFFFLALLVLAKIKKP
jgi:hypothetical protein